MLLQHEAGKVRILATMGDKRSPFAPLVPTLKELGLPVSASGWNAFFAPASMPKERQDRLGRLLVEIMQDPDTRRKFLEASLVAVVNTPVQTAAAIARYRAQWAPVVRRVDLRP
jgi:tripartite-type tricarboxylate transporter receptor subunit TctC